MFEEKQWIKGWDTNRGAACTGLLTNCGIQPKTPSSELCSLISIDLASCSMHKFFYIGLSHSNWAYASSDKAS